MHAFRLLAGAVLLLVALAFFGTLLCRPIRERQAAPPPAALRGLADPRPAPLDPEEFAAEQRSARVLSNPPTTLKFQVHDADSGKPLAGARIVLRAEGPDEEVLSQEYTADPRGGCELRGLPAREYRIQVYAEGFFPSEESTLDFPADATLTASFALRPAALLRGSLFTLDGSPVAHGFLRLRPLQPPGETRLVEVDPRGDRFRSPPLPAGIWEVAFVETPDAVPDPRLVRSFALVPRQQRVLRLTIQRPGMADDPRGERLPGIKAEEE